MKKQMLILSISVCFMVLTCSKESPEVTAYSLRMPSDTPAILRHELRTDQDFSTGYANGNIRSDRIHMCWKKLDDPSFLVYKILRDGVTIKTISDIRSSCLSDSNLISGRQYFYKVAAFLRNGAAKTDTITLKTPLLLSPVSLDYEYISESSIRLFWKNRMESAFLYLVYRKQGAEDFVLQKSVADTFFVDDSVRVGETFQYKIVPKNVYETGDSSTVTVTIQRVFNPPAIVSIKQLPGSRSVEIQWTDNSNAEVNYWVYRDGLIISKLDPNSTVFVDNDTTNSLQVGETYRYYVEITDRGGKVQASGEQQITITDPGLPPFSFLIDSALISQNRIADI